MAIKALIVSFITSIIAVGCVAFPEDGYDSRGYGQPVYRDYGYGQRYDPRYDRNNDRQRWERERAYRLQQMRIEQERRQKNWDKQRWQYEQAKRDQMKKKNGNNIEKIGTINQIVTIAGTIDLIKNSGNSVIVKINNSNVIKDVMSVKTEIKTKINL